MKLTETQKAAARAYRLNTVECVDDGYATNRVFRVGFVAEKFANDPEHRDHSIIYGGMTVWEQDPLEFVAKLRSMASAIERILKNSFPEPTVAARKAK